MDRKVVQTQIILVTKLLIIVSLIKNTISVS